MEIRVKLIQDVAYRWNSTYDMLESILTNKPALSALPIESEVYILVRLYYS